MWSLFLAVDKLLRMVGEEDEDGSVDVGGGGGTVSSTSCDSLHHGSHFVDVPHVRQLFNWDCGLACVLMVLQTLGVEDHDIHDLEELCCTKSVWTVDLAYLLQRFSVKFSFFTVTIGANPKFSAEVFYQEQLQEDLRRVDQLFEKAFEAGISIQHKSVSGEELSILILSGKFIAIALVDKIKLSQSSSEEFCVSEYYGGSLDYMGHYVVICGYDACRHEFEIRDPASPRKYRRVSLECLDEAHKSYGTDEDILVVSLAGKNGSELSPRPRE